MWANWEIVALADWMQNHNKGLVSNKKVGFYGLDVYSLWESMESIMQYLKKTDVAALKVAEDAYRCFEPYRKDECQGYARATDMSDDGMYNIGELARLEHNDKGVVLVGFGSFKGSVMAGKNWGAPMQAMHMPEARRGSWEYLLHKAGPENKLFLMNDFLSNDVFMENHIGHRAIGVVYNPVYEQYGNYVPTILPLRYDSFIYLDETNALHPLHIQPDGHQIPETYPFGV
jgi:erythromycin esterase-like protein